MNKFTNIIKQLNKGSFNGKINSELNRNMILNNVNFNYKTKSTDSINNNAFDKNEKVGLILTLKNSHGTLLEILKILEERKINLTHIRSKPSLIVKKKSENNVDIHIDIEKNNNENDILQAIEKISSIAKRISFSDVQKIPWFPKFLIDLNKLGLDLKMAGDALQSDHPGFNDSEYRARREVIEKASKNFYFDGTKNPRCPDVDYTEEETRVWTLMFDELKDLHIQHACQEYNENLEKMYKEKLMVRDRIPQLNELNDYYSKNTKMFLRPTGGLLSEREFLNSLAFRVFPSTQYIRHGSKPLYTPEPDIVHEFLGHAAMFADEDFVHFSQEIGLASLGASEEQIKKLGSIYWFSVEFGLCKQNGQKKIYGGGILSSPSEIRNAAREDVKCLPFDLEKMSTHFVDICNIQTEYFLAPSFQKMIELVKAYGDNMNKSFNVSYDLESHSINVDRNILLDRNSELH